MRAHRLLKRLVPTVGLVALTTCGGQSPAPSAPGAPSPGGEGVIVRGTERIGWDQAAESHEALAAIRYATYVDGRRTLVSGARCADSPGAGGYSCTAPLPSLTPGTHVLELAAFREGPTGVVEGARSAPLRITLVATSAVSVAGEADATVSIALGDGTRLRAETLATGLEAPTAVAVAPDARLFVAERAGRVTVLSPDRIPSTTTLADVAPDVEAGLLDLALHPDFARNGFVYAAYTATGADGRLIYRISRFREAGGILGERAVLLDDVPAQPTPAAAIGSGPDRKLYVSLGAHSEDGSLASYAGKILRLNDDGTTPHDNPGLSPIWSSGHDAPQGFDWRLEDGDLWEVERVAGRGDELNRIVAGAYYGDLDSPATARAGSMTMPPVVSLPAGLNVSGAAFYRGDRIGALQGDLLISALEGRDLIRVRFDSRNRERVAGMERVFEGRFGRVSGVEVGPDGAVYVLTANRERGEARAGDDRLVRLVPVSPPTDGAR